MNIKRELHQLTKTSILTGKVHTVDMHFSEEEWREIQPFLSGDKSKARLIQDILPFHTADEREFVLSGIIPQEWEALK